MTKTVNIGLFLWCACSLCLGQDLAPPILAPGDAPPLPTLGLAACLTGRNEVPANDSPYKGSGKFTLNGTLLNYEVTLASRTLTPPKAGIYGPAADGTNGEVIFVWTNRS